MEPDESRYILKVDNMIQSRQQIYTNKVFTDV